MTRAAGGGRKGGKQLASTAPSCELITRIDPPDELIDDNAVSIWQTTSKILIERKLLTLDHAPMLMSYCNSFSRYLEAEEILSDQGLTIATASGGEKKHPAMNVRQDALSSMTRLGSLLGLDPLSRARLSGGTGGDGDDGANEFEEFKS